MTKLIMKQLTKQPRFQDYYIDDFEVDIGVTFPLYFKDFLKKYAGFSTEENTYVDGDFRVFEIVRFCKKNDRILADYGEGIKAKGMGFKIPFAYANSQNTYCICLDNENYGAAFLFTLTGTWNNVDGTLEKVCDSFSEFINGLQIDSEFDKNHHDKFSPDFIKELTIITITDAEFNKIKSKLEISLPQNYIDLMKEYADSSVYENTFYDKNQKKYGLASFCTFSMIDARTDEYLEEKSLDDENLYKNIGLQLPFAIDGGGYRFCLSLDKKTYGKVFFLMEELLSIDEKDAFVFLADSLEDFIDGLQSEENT